MRIVVGRLPPPGIPASHSGRTAQAALETAPSRRTAESVKAEGSQAFARCEYTRATELFTLAIQLGGPRHALYGNRSAAHAAAGEWSEALASAELMLHFCTSPRATSGAAPPPPCCSR